MRIGPYYPWSAWILFLDKVLQQLYLDRVSTGSGSDLLSDEHAILVDDS